MDKSTLGVYVHVPFCVQKCSYCDFLSFDNSIQVEDDYFKALYRELTFSLKRLAGSYEISMQFLQSLRGKTGHPGDQKNVDILFQHRHSRLLSARPAVGAGRWNRCSGRSSASSSP